MMKKNFVRGALRGGSAMQALALLGAGLASTAILATPAAAQDFTNVTASGRVTGPDGQGIAGATVTVTSNAQGFSNSVTTDSSGGYRVPALPIGEYTFEVSAPGFQTFTDSAVNLTQGTAGNSFRLAPEGATAGDGDIVVTGARIRVSDFDRTTTGAVIQIGELAERVPVARDITSVILLAPGTGEGDASFGNLAAVAGSSVSENAFFVNGLNITDFRQGLGAVGVPFDFYNTVEVKNGSIPAEFGRFTGGFINATTKSGGNDFHGGVLFNWEPDGLREDSPNTIGAAAGPALLTTGFNKQDTRSVKNATFNLSGPIIKDHLFFYAFYQTNDTQTGDTLLTSNPATAVPGQTNQYYAPFSTGLRREERSLRSPFWGGKLDAIIIDGQRLEFTYFDSSQVTRVDNFNVSYANGGPNPTTGDPVVTGYNNTLLLRGGGENYVGRYTGQFTDWLTISAAYGKNKRDQITGSTTDDYPFISDPVGFCGGCSGNALNGINFNKDTREFYRGDVDLYFNAFGQHHVKFGYDREKLTTIAETRYTGGVAWQYQNSGPSGDTYVSTPNTFYVTGRTFINGGTFKSDNESFYVQDAWSLLDNRLNLNIGVRADKFTNDNVAGVTYYDSDWNWAPRLSFSFDPAGDGRTKIYGFYGTYFLPVVANTNIRLAGAELDYTRYFLVNGVNSDNTPILGAPITGFSDATNCPDTGVANCDIISDGQPTPTEATVAKGLKAQSVDEFVLGIERSLGSRIRVGLYGQYRKLNQSLEDVAIDAAVLAYCQDEGISGCEDIWTGFHQYVLSNPGKDATITLSNPLPGETGLRTVDFTAEQLGYPKARRKYTSITATFDRDFDGVWSLSGSYTWSKSKGNIEGGIRSDNGQTDSGLTTAFDQPGLTIGSYGYLPGDARHRFKLYGSYAVTDWFTLGAQFQLSSPRRYGCIGRVPNSVDPFAGAYGAAGFFCNVANGEVVTDPAAGTGNPPQSTLQPTPRGSVFKSDWLSFLNLSAAVRVPTDLFNATFRVDVFNVFNQKAGTDYIELGTLANGNPRGDYGYTMTYQTPRYFRFQLGFDF